MAFKKAEIPLSLGQRVTLKVRNEVFNVQVRGWCTGQYIILDLPKVGADYFRVAPQTGLQIHYTKEGVFVNFKSTSILTFVQAISLLIIEYPRDVDTHNLRKYARFKANLPVSYFSENDEQKKRRCRNYPGYQLGWYFIYSHTSSRERGPIENNL